MVLSLCFKSLYLSQTHTEIFMDEIKKMSGICFKEIDHGGMGED